MSVRISASRSGAVVLAVCLLSVGLALAIAAPAHAACNWTVVSNHEPQGTSGTLDGVAALSADDAWAVGSVQRPNRALPLAEHWDGTAWHVVPTPLNHVKIREFHDVTALGPDDVWAVGTEIRLRTGVIHPLTEHWDGTSWSLVNAPDGGAARGELKGVAAGSSGNVWAVGYREVSGHSEPLVMRWDGTRWHVLAAPPGDALNDVTPRRSGTIWTVGSNPFGINHALLARRLDSGWVTSDVPPRVLKAMAWYRASDGWAVGYKPGPHSAPLQPLVVHWDGSSWIESPTPELHRSAELRGVAAISSHQVW